MANALPQSTSTRSRRSKRATTKSSKHSAARPSNRPAATRNQPASAKETKPGAARPKSAPAKQSKPKRRAPKDMSCPPAPATRGRDWEVRKGDALYHLKKLESESVTAVITDPPYAYAGGIYGRAWDRQSAAHTERLWQEVERVLVPGGFAVSFAAASTFHRLACAMEMGGLELRDQLLWLRSGGSANGSVGLDVERAGGNGDLYAGHTAQLVQAHEPIALTRKPFDGTLAANIATWGTGALNAHACRFRNEGEHRAISPVPADEVARHPSNVLIGPEAARVVDRQSGWSRSRRTETSSVAKRSRHGGSRSTNRGPRGHNDSGGASRFQYRPSVSEAERCFGLPAGVEPHETPKPQDVMTWLCRLVMPPLVDGREPGLIVDPFTGGGSTGMAALTEGYRFLGFERDVDHARRARWRLRAWERELG